jgi:ribonuclease HI
MGHRIRDWFSSTRAELFAIWSALLCAPYDSEITIYTDSQSAIDLLKKFSKLEKISVRDFFNINNALVIAKIIETIREKNLHVEYIKIKARNGIEYNEVADKIAKRAAYEGESWYLTYESTDAVNILFTPIWNGYIIDKS